MATAVKPVHLKGESISAPSTPRRVLLSHGRRTTADSPNGDIPVAKEKPTPNYLKPTISSCHDTWCGYPKSQQQQHAEDSIAAAGAGKRLISVKSMEKPALRSSLNKSPKWRTSRTDLSPKAALSPKIVSEKASKAPTVGKTLARAKSLPKNMPKRREASAIKPEQEEKVLFIDSGVQGHAARHGSQPPKSNTDGKHRTISEDSDTGKPRAPPGKVWKKVCGNGGPPKKLKFQGDGKKAAGERLKFKQREKGVEVAGEGKVEQENVVLKRQEVKEWDELPAYDVIGETAAKLATRRSKVKALVGAFESVISLQETETRPTQREQEEAAVKVGRVDQPAQLKPAMEVKIGEEVAEKGRPGRAKPKKKVKVDGKVRSGSGRPGQRQLEEEEKGEEHSGEEKSKGSQWGQQKETKGEEEECGREGSKGGQLGQESQQKETEAKESKGEEGGAVVVVVVVEDGSNATKDLTESLEKGEGENAKEIC